MFAKGNYERYPQKPPTTYTIVKQPKHRVYKTQPRKAISHLEKDFRCDASLSARFRQKSGSLLWQMKQLLEEEELRRNSRAKSPSLHSTASSPTNLTLEGIFSQNTTSSSGILDSGYRTEDITETPATPRPLAFDFQEATWPDGDATHLQAGFKPLYECTKEHCNYSTYSEVDWRRHAQGEKHWPQERFMYLQCPAAAWDPIGNPMCPFCFDPALSLTSLTHIQLHFLQCPAARDEGKTCGRRDHFCPHLRDQHLISNATSYAESWVYPVDSDWSRPCGFCGISVRSWVQRMNHIAQQ
jgi:hypothetical protein